MGRRKLKNKKKGGEPQKKKQKMTVVQPSSSRVKFGEDVDPKDKAFGIDIIWRKLAQRLNYYDLKALRLVSTQFNNDVLYKTNFIKRTIVNLVPIDRLSPSQFGSTTVLWKHIKINQTASKTQKKEEEEKDNLDWFYPLLESAECISVLTLSFQPDSPNLDKIIAAPAPNTLKELVLHANLLMTCTTAKALSELSEAAKNNLKGVQELLVHSMIPVPGYDYKNEFMHHLIKSNNLLRPHLNNLRVIRIENIQAKSMYTYDIMNIVEAYFFNDWVFQMRDGLVKIIEQSQNTLEELDVTDMNMWLKLDTATCSFYPNGKKTSFKSVFDMTFPRLKSLSMKILSQEKPLITFLDKQPELEELSIKYLNKFPIKVMEKIQEKSQKLKKLVIKTKGFDEKKVDMWNFLKDLNTLEDFGMEFITSNEIPQNPVPAKILLSCLPRSIKKLHLAGFEYENPENFDPESIDDPHILKEADFERIDGQKLTHLTLRSMNDGFTVDIDTLEFICNNFTMLQHLDLFGSGENVYDALGIKIHGQYLTLVGSALKNLQGLRSLTLNCKDVTNTTYLNFIKFKELAHLEISVEKLSKRSVESSTIPLILKSNPSLRTFLLFGESIRLYDMETMRKWNSRIQSVEVKALSETYDLDEDASDYDRDDDYDYEDSDDDGPDQNSDNGETGDSANEEAQNESSDENDSSSSENQNSEDDNDSDN